MLHRPIQCLYPLEISLQEKAVSPPNLPEANPDDNSGDADKVVVRRSKRAAASEARDRILDQSLGEN